MDRFLDCREKSLLERYQPIVNSYEFKLIQNRLDLLPLVSLSKAIPEKCSIFELGCGRGIIANLLAEDSRERKVIGIDLSAPRIELARKAAKGLDNVSYYIGDITLLRSLPMETEIKPCVFILSQVLYLLTKKQAVNLLCRISYIMGEQDTLWIVDYTTRPFWKYIFLRFENAALLMVVIAGRIMKHFWKGSEQLAVRLFGERERLARIPSPAGWRAFLDKVGLEYETLGFIQSSPYPQILIRSHKRNHL